MTEIILRTNPGKLPRHSGIPLGFTTIASESAKRPKRAVVVAVCLLLGACASFDPVPPDEVPFKDRKVTQSAEGITVSTVVLSAEESEQIFDSDYYKNGVQPVWLKVENNSPDYVYLLPASLDRQYFAPLEVSYKHRYTMGRVSNERMDAYLQDVALEYVLPPGATHDGFVFTHLEYGTKSFIVDLFKSGAPEGKKITSFTFFVNVPGLDPDYSGKPASSIYSPDQMVGIGAESLRSAIDAMPANVLHPNFTEPGEPLNVVFVAEAEQLLYSLIRARWDETEQGDASGVTKLRGSGGERYRPVEQRIAFGRSQDASFRRNRQESTVSSFYLRIWLAPITVDGTPVWLGQMGRDNELGGKAAVIDTVEARSILLQDLLYNQSLKKLAFAKRGDIPFAPAMYTAPPDSDYIADGYRAVGWISFELTSMADLEYVEWEDRGQR